MDGPVENSEPLPWTGMGRELLEGVSSPALIVDSEGYVVYANPPARSLFGLPAGHTLSGHSIGDASFFGSYGGAGEGHFSDPLGVAARARRTGEPVHGVQVLLERAQGSHRLVADVVPLHTGFGSISAVVVLYRDATSETAALAEYRWARDELRRALKNTTLLLESAEALSSEMPLADALHAMCDIVLGLVAHDRATVLLLTPNGDELETAASRGLDPAPLGRRLPVASEGLQRVVAESRTAILERPVLRKRDHPLDTAGTAQLTLTVPLVYQDRLQGVLCVDDIGEPNDFSRGEITLVEGLADQASVAIERARNEDALRDSEARIRDLIRHAPSAIFEVTLDPLRFVSANEAGLAMTGYTAEELGAVDMRDLLDEPSRRLFDEQLQLARTGEGLADDVEYRLRRKDGSFLFLLVNPSVTRDPEGRPIGALVVAHDVTARRLAEDALRVSLDTNRALADASSLLASTMDLNAAMPAMLARIGSAIDAVGADVALVEGDGFRIAHGWGMLTALEGGLVSREEVPLRTRVLVEGKPVFVPDVTTESEIVTNNAAELGVVSVILQPLEVRGQIIGTLDFGFAKHRAFDAETASLLSRVAYVVSTSLENARLYQAEHRIAETLQETLVVLPLNLSGVAFSRAYESATTEPGRVGGDFVDLFEIRGPLVGVAIGDVSGKGIDAAVITSLVRNTIRAHAVDGLPPFAVCEKTNTVMRRFTQLDTYVTLFYGVLNTRTGLLRYVIAGHPPPLILSPNKNIGELAGGSPILGAFDDPEFRESQVVLGSGDRLILYTDGITEARLPEGGRFFGFGALKRSLTRHASKKTENLADALMKEAVKFSSGVLRDDAAILVVEPTRLQSASDEHPPLNLDTQ